MLIDKLNQIIHIALKQEIASAIALKVSFGNNSKSITIAHGFTHKKALEHISDTAIFDLASLTKILLTSPLVAQAVLEGRFSFKDKPFPSWPGVSIGHLLAHTSGLPAHKRYKKDFFNELFLEKLVHKIGEKREYSDLGFLALGYLLEKTYKESLKNLAIKLYKKLGCNLSFTPKITHQIVATTKKGEVHDDNCHFLGGIAGHAGLFGNINDVDKMGCYFLKCFKYPENSYQSILQYMIKKGFGFDKPRKNGTVVSLSPQSFGHFGYTGTSLWIDPKAQGLVISLLTNRVHMSNRPQGIFWLRKKIHDTISFDMLKNR